MNCMCVQRNANDELQLQLATKNTWSGAKLKMLIDYLKLQVRHRMWEKLTKGTGRN